MPDKTRYAVVRASSLDVVEALLPDNYAVVTAHYADPYGLNQNFVIEGHGPAAWLPLVLGREYPTRNDAETAACSVMN